MSVNSLVFAFQIIYKPPTTVYKIHISGIGTRTQTILSIDVELPDYGTYTLAYGFTYYCTNYGNFTYLNFTGLPGESFKLRNITLPWPTNRFKLYSAGNDVILHWWLKNGSAVDYVVLKGLVRVHTRYSPPY